MVFLMFQLLYMTLAVIKLMGVALVTQHVVNACQEEKGNIIVATEGTPDSSNKTEHFSYKGEWVNA